MLEYNIVLIGFMGAGKSTIAKYFGLQYAMDIIEMDQMIEEQEKKSIPEIFRLHGEEYFRDLETALLVKLQEKKNQVISCGGGAVLRECNVKEMKKNGRVVLLTARPEEIYNRIKEDEQRPVLKGRKTIEGITQLMKERQPKYEAAADIVISTGGKSAADICKEIVEKLKGMDES